MRISIDADWRTRVESGWHALQGRGRSAICSAPILHALAGRATQASRQAAHQASKPRGFTLIEVLMASFLMAMLLSGLWAIFNIYSHLFETGGVQVSQAQLMTALERQLTDDLQNAIEDSPNSKAAAGSAGGMSAAVRRFGLLGTRNTLRFDVLETLPEDQIPTVEEASLLDRSAEFKPHVSELKTIVYRFTAEQGARVDLEPESLGATVEGTDHLFTGTTVPGPGLIRQEIDFETPQTETNVQSTSRDLLNETSNTSLSRGTAVGAEFEDMLAQATASDAQTWLPEVRWMTFRYFDGQAWSEHWNSLDRGSLPVAVEVRLRLRDAADLSQRQRTEDDLSRTANEMDDTSEKASAVDDPFSLDDDDDENLAKGRSAYRLFIRLPTARKRPELKPVDVSNSAVGTAGERIPVMGRSRGARSIPFSGIDLPGSIPLPSAQSGHTSGDSGSSGESRSDQWMRVSPK